MSIEVSIFPPEPPQNGEAPKLYISEPQHSLMVARLGTVILDRDIPVDAVLAIARGGLPTAAKLAHRLGVKTSRVWSSAIEGYDDTDIIEGPPEVLHLPDPEELEGAHLLVVEDLADTGKALNALKGKLKDSGAYNLASYTVAASVWKPKSLVVPDVAFGITNRWVVLPPEREPELTAETTRLRSLQAGDAAIEQAERNFAQSLQDVGATNAEMQEMRRLQIEYEQSGRIPVLV